MSLNTTKLSTVNAIPNKLFISYQKKKKYAI
nr:MAG TPA: hypothetical protein [Caudoviricetes sp.]